VFLSYLEVKMTKFEKLMDDLQLLPHSAAWNDHVQTWNAALESQPLLDTKSHPLHHVGIAVVLWCEFQVLLQHRGKDFGYGKKVLPGGTLDEANPVTGVLREVKEEIGVDLDPAADNLAPIYFAHDRKSDGSPYLMLYYAAGAYRWKGSERNMEPSKCLGLDWHHMASLPADMWENDRMAINRVYRMLWR
jgi:8-oxo-dGTP pyrophosphatase MutT (NUDIX family)